jgi:ERCC4-related helicase
MNKIIFEVIKKLYLKDKKIIYLTEKEKIDYEYEILKENFDIQNIVKVSTQWEDIYIKKDIILITGEIFLQCLNNLSISIEGINLIIFDECTNSKKNNHEYFSIMSNFYHFVEKKPYILGKTNFPVSNNILKDKENIIIEKDIVNLKKLFDSKIILINDEEKKYNEKFIICSQNIEKKKILNEINNFKSKYIEKLDIIEEVNIYENILNELGFY